MLRNERYCGDVLTRKQYTEDHDYTSGFIKSVFTNHSLKHDYILSKSAIGLFSMLCICFVRMS